MEALNLYKTQPIPLYPIDLPEFYSADYWNISTLDIYKNANAETSLAYIHFPFF